ncbi:MAG TPA: acetate/propionate family kinase [Thermomicrobiales bacterium]|nr:acetate/propionate family kinase [Thermomicrobiales bacterium]
MPERTVLTVNTGSSSLKAAVFDAANLHDRYLTAQVEHIGHASALIVMDGSEKELANEPLVAKDHDEALQALIAWLGRNGEIEPLLAIGHRVVHGGADFSAPQRIDDTMVFALEQLIPFAPNHMPQALMAIAATRRAFPGLPQVACFDTAFHRSMPPVAQRYPLPPEFERAGVVRYGFHGLSYASIVDRLGPGIAPRTVIAHLGNGASMAALRHGKSIDTTMGFTPLGGLMMGTRPGDLDPGVMLYLLQETGKTLGEVAELVTNQAGLRGVSQRSADMKTLLDHENDDSRTAAALELYVYLARKQLGGLLAVLGGIDLLVFTGGIGEHAAEIRERIGRDFGWAGIRIDPEKNGSSARATRDPSTSLGMTRGMDISYSGAPVRVLVLPSDEERMIARDTLRLIAGEHAS